MKKHILAAILTILVVAVAAFAYLGTKESTTEKTEAKQQEEQVIKSGKKWVPEWVDRDKGVLKPIQPEKPAEVR